MRPQVVLFIYLSLSTYSDAVFRSWGNTAKSFRITKYGRDSLARGLVSFCLVGLPYLQPCAAVEQSVGTIVVEEGETSRIYQKALQTLSDSDFDEAQKLLEEVVQVQPDFIDGWSNLGNVLTSKGELDDAMLCYRKALSLSPPKGTLWVILLNKASIELATGKSSAALKDLEIAERVGGPQPAILTNRAVALSNENKWDEACTTFERVISNADRNALPWWLRYSLSLLEVGRGTEAVAFLQRSLNRFPDETECKAFAVALYSSLGTKAESARYWRQMTPADRELYKSPEHLSSTLKWGSKAIEGFRAFLASEYAVVN